MPRESLRWATFIACLGLATLTWLVFGQTLRHEFVNYDDGSYVYQNPNVARGLSVSGFARAFTHIHSQNWHPLTTLSHMLDCQLFGLRAGWHHFTNVLLHSIAAILLFLVLKEITGTVWRSLFVAAAFAVHPLRAESVAWIAERKDSLSGVFFMLTLAAYAGYTRSPSFGRYLVLSLSFALGLMSKPMLVTVPLVLLLIDYWPLNRLANGRTFRNLVIEKIPLFVLSAVSCVAAILAQKQATGAADQLPFFWRLNNAIVSYAIYIWQMFWPAKLAVFYPHPENQLPVWQLLLSFALLVAITALAFVYRRQRPYLVTGWLWYLIMLFPVIGIFQVGLQGHADRYTYLPHIGLYLAITWFVAEMPIWQRREHIRTALAALVLVALSLAAWRQTSYWKNSETLWTRALQVTPSNDVALAGLGGILLGRGKVDEAVSNFQRALRVRPDNPEAHRGLADALMQNGKALEAIAHWQKTIELQPEDVAARDNLGVALVGQGRVGEAVAQWKKSLEHEPNDGNALSNLAWVLAVAPDPSLRDGERAVQFAQRALKLSDSRNAIIFRTLAAAYAEQGQFAEAIAAAKRGLEIASEQGGTGLAEELRRNIMLYESNTALRDNSLTGSAVSP